MANRSKRTPQRERAIFDHLRQGRSIASACDAAGIGRRTYYEWRDESPEFAAAADEAYDIGTDNLEDVALTMSIQGNVPVLLAMLKARRREKWGDRVANEHSGPGGGPIPITGIAVPLPVPEDDP